MTVGDPKRVYAGESMADRRLDRRRRFLQAGIEVLGTKGYHASSVGDICATAGLARSQFYSEFTNRERLLIEVYDLITRDAEAAVVSALAASTSRDHRTLIAVAITSLINSVGGDFRRTRICYIEMAGVSAAVEQHRASRRSGWTDFFESTVRGEVGDDFVPPGGYELAATAFLGAFTEVVSTWSRTAEPRQPVSRLVETMVAVLSAFVPDLD